MCDVIYIDPSMSSKEPTDIYFDGQPPVRIWSKSLDHMIEQLTSVILQEKPRKVIVDTIGFAGRFIFEGLYYKFNNVQSDNGSYHRHKREHGITK